MANMFLPSSDPALSNPMTTAADLIIGGAGGAPTRLANGSANQVLMSAGGTTAETWNFPLGSVISKSANYTLGTVASDGTVLCSGAAFTITLPTAIGVSGQIYTIKKTDASLTNIITLNTTLSQTIDGIATGVYTLTTVNESLTVMSDGANWRILDHKTATAWSSGVATTITSTGSNPTKGTTTTDSIKWQRIGAFAHVRVDYATSAGGAAGTGMYKVAMPTGLVIDTTQTGTSTTATIAGDTGRGPATLFSSGHINNINQTAHGIPTAVVFDANTFCVFLATNSTTAFAPWGLIGSSNYTLDVTVLGLGLEFKVPISGWQP